MLTIVKDWELCVSDTSFEKAKGLFESPPLSEIYEAAKPITRQLACLLHTFPRFKKRGVKFTFFLVPSSDYRIDLSPENCEKSPLGLPYPKLERLAQSLLEMQHLGDLCDLVDAMDLSEEWGEKYLGLGRPSEDSREYALQKNEKLKVGAPIIEGMTVASFLNENLNARPIWDEFVRNKHKRVAGRGKDPERWTTQYRRKGSSDPRLRDRYGM